MALTAINFDKLLVDKFLRVTGLSKSTSELKFIFDQIKDGNIENTEDKQYVTGVGGVNLAALKRNKAAKVSFNNAYLVMSAMAVQTGSAVEVASVENKFTVPMIDLKVVDSVTTAALSATPIASSLKYIYKANKDGTQGEKYTLAATTASATEFTLTGTAITLPTGIFAAGDRFIASYSTEKTVGKKISNNANVVSEDVYLIVEAICRDACNTNIMYYTKIVFSNASVDGNFNINVGDSPEPHAFSAESMLDPCSSSGSLWDWYIVE